MVRIKATRDVTHNGMAGTVYIIRALGVTEGGASSRVKGALAGRFPVNIGKLEVVNVEKTVSDIPGIDAYVVSVFMPYNNPSNPNRII